MRQQLTCQLEADTYTRLAAEAQLRGTTTEALASLAIACYLSGEDSQRIAQIEDAAWQLLVDFKALEQRIEALENP